MQEFLLCLQNSSPRWAGGEARDDCRPGVREDAGWSRPSCCWWDESGASWDEPSCWIPVKSYVPRTGSCSWEYAACTGSAGPGSRKALS